MCFALRGQDTPKAGRAQAGGDWLSCQHRRPWVSPFSTPSSDCFWRGSSIGTSGTQRHLSTSTPSCSQPAGRHFDPASVAPPVVGGQNLPPAPRAGIQCRADAWSTGRWSRGLSSAACTTCPASHSSRWSSLTGVRIVRHGRLEVYSTDNPGPPDRVDRAWFTAQVKKSARSASSTQFTFFVLIPTASASNA